MCLGYVARRIPATHAGPAHRALPTFEKPRRPPRLPCQQRGIGVYCTYQRRLMYRQERMEAMASGKQSAPTLSTDEALRLERLSGLLRVLADEKRLTMVYLLAGGELCVCRIMEALGISQALASHHLGVLRQAGLVHDRRDARWVYYSLDPLALAELERFLFHLRRQGAGVSGAGGGAAACPRPACDRC
jgi:DNA-binding transcriptional ArsR family regulator